MHWLNEFGGQLQQLQCISEQPEQTRLSLPFFAANLAGACLYMLIHTHTHATRQSVLQRGWAPP